MTILGKSTYLGQPLTLLPPDTEPDIAAYIIKNQDMIPASDLMQSLLHRVVIGVDQITIHINVQKLSQVIERYLKVRMTCDAAIITLDVPFKIGKAKSGAIVIKPTTSKGDIFDLPPDQLKRLV